MPFIDKDFIDTAAKFGTPENIEFIVGEIKRFMKDYPSNFKTIFALCTRDIKLLKFLIEIVGFDVNTKGSTGRTILSSIHVSAKTSSEIAEYLIQKGADVNTQDNYGDTPLLRAVRFTSQTLEQFNFRKLLLKHGASVTLKNNVGLAPIDLDPKIETRYNEDRSMAYYDDRTVADLAKPSLAELRAKYKNGAEQNKQFQL